MWAGERRATRYAANPEVRVLGQALDLEKDLELVGR